MGWKLAVDSSKSVKFLSESRKVRRSPGVDVTSGPHPLRVLRDLCPVHDSNFTGTIQVPGCACGASISPDISDRHPTWFWILVLTIMLDTFIIHDQETLGVLFTDLETPRLEADFSQEFQKHSSIEEILLLMVVNDCKVTSNPRWHPGRKCELFQELSVDTCMIGCLQINGTRFEVGRKLWLSRGIGVSFLLSIQNERNVAAERTHGDFYSSWFQSMSFSCIFIIFYKSMSLKQTA